MSTPSNRFGPHSTHGRDARVAKIQQASAGGSAVPGQARATPGPVATSRLQQPLTAEVFERLVLRLAPEQLRELPTACLPPDIPLHLVDPERDRDRWAALEELAWRVTERDLDRRASALEELGESATRALEICENESAGGAEELRGLCDALAEPCRAGNPAEDPLSTAGQNLEQANDQARQIADRVGTLGGALATIERARSEDEAVQTRIEQARQRARKTLSQLEWALARFHALELDIAAHEMTAKAIDCDRGLQRIQDLDQRIAAVQAQCKRDQSPVSRLLSSRTARYQREARVQRLEALRRSHEATDIFIDEDDLLRWLDVLVNANLYTDPDRWRKHARNVRSLLYRLLCTYCLQQELAAHKVATRPMVGINGREAIDYYLKSERFILNYFARKREEVMQWLSGAAEAKLAQLDYTRDALLAEYRRHLRGATDAQATATAR